jgi:predicted deacylase
MSPLPPRPFLRPPIVQEINLDTFTPGIVHRVRVVMTENASGNETMVPVFVLRAKDEEKTPVVAVTAVVHGNELNGIPVIHRLMEQLETHLLLRGTVIAVPIVNVPGYMAQQREFEDNADLNRIMPGRAIGNESQIYAHRFIHRIIARCNYLIDLHTASFGRANSLYVRADMSDPVPAKLARLIAPQIIVHTPGADGTLRSAAAALGIHAITVEVGDPHRLQPGMIKTTRLGIQEVLEHLGMLHDLGNPEPGDIIECKSSLWMFTDRGGVLDVLPDLTQHVKQGELIAKLRNVWGDVVREYEAPEDGVIVGKSTNPSARAGSRIVHLGRVGRL